MEWEAMPRPSAGGMKPSRRPRVPMYDGGVPAWRSAGRPERRGRARRIHGCVDRRSRLNALVWYFEFRACPFLGLAYLVVLCDFVSPRAISD